MATIAGKVDPSLQYIIVTPQNSGDVQLDSILGDYTIQQDGSYNFQLAVGIYDIQLYDIRSLKRLQRYGVYVRADDTIITLEGLLARH